MNPKGSPAQKKARKAKKALRVQSRATRDSAAQQQDLSTQVVELQAQIAALKALVEHTRASSSPVSGFRSQVSASSHVTGDSPLVKTAQSYPSTLDARPSTPLAAAEQTPPSAIRHPSSAGAKPLPIYELKETRPVDYEASGIAQPAYSEESADGFFTSLLDRARICWLMGDWDKLSKIELEQIREHPERGKLALFGAYGRIQTGQSSDAKRYLAFAKAQGCSSKLIKSILLSGIHSSLYSANLLAGRETNGDHHLLELKRIGLLKPGTVGRGELAPSITGVSPSPQKTFAHLEIPVRIAMLARKAASGNNLADAVASLLKTEDFSARERFLFLFQLAKEFGKTGNKMVASSFLEEALQSLDLDASTDYFWFVVKELLDLGLPEEAFAKRLLIPDNHPVLSTSEASSLHKAGKTLLEKILDIKGHGQELLLATVQRHADRLRAECAGRKPVLVEIGTTRESASGQGSTRRLADFCHREDFHLITVDMDHANIEMARQMFKQKSYSFEAIHAKGEDFLANHSGPVDFIFLDAYDFDHGQHTELRQSRYEKFLGSRISEVDCHRMHLDCARAVIKIAKPWTLVCVDDTWLHLGRWTAKGTLAVPFLLENGFHFLDIRNRAVLMGTRYWLDQVPMEKPY